MSDLLLTTPLIVLSLKLVFVALPSYLQTMQLA